jgi:hypothetical protein
MKANRPEEHCEDCVFMDRRTGQMDSCCNQDPRCKDKGSKQSFSEPCEFFRPSRAARVARSLDRLSWNIEELVNLASAEDHRDRAMEDDDE